MQQKILNFKKQRLETSCNLSIEQLKETNPKLYPHVKRALKVERLNMDLKDEYHRLKEERKKLGADYYNITKAFTLEEKIRQKLGESEQILKDKERKINELTRELTDFQEKIHVTKQKIQNIEVKKLLFEYNQVRATKEQLIMRKYQINQDIIEAQECLEKTSKNPQKISPTTANQNLRTEICGIESTIIDASKNIKELEKEYTQVQYQYEEAVKVLHELMKPVVQPICIPRNSMARRATLRDLSSPTSPTKKSVTIRECPSATIVTERVETSQIASPESRRESVREESPFSRRSMGHAESPGSSQKRASILQMVGKGMTETLTEQLSKVLKGVGKPGTSLASKLLAVNRGEIVGKGRSK